MSIVTRASKGAALTHNEMDNNFTELRDRPDGQVYPKTAGIGIKVDTTTPTFPWKEMQGTITDKTGANNPTFNTYRGNIRQYQFAVNEELFIEFHLLHDYVPGTNLYIHTHWSHDSSSVSAGSVSWEYDVSYAKGYDQGAFHAPVIISGAQTASLTQYQHMISELQLSAAGGTGGLINTDILEVDGLFLVRLKLSANTISPATNPFLHMVDIHYQSTNLGTKNKNYNFYT